MYLRGLRNRSIGFALKSNDAEVSLHFIDLASCRQDLRVFTFAEQSDILMNKSHTIILNGGSHLVNLILEVELDPDSLLTFILISVNNQIFTALLVNLSNLNFVNMNNACSVDGIAQQNISFAFMKSDCLARFLVDVDNLRVAGAPDHVHFARLRGNIIWRLVHNLELNCGTNVNVHR